MDIPLIRHCDIDRELCKRKLSYFVKYFWDVIEPSTELVWNWHIDVICDHVQALYEGILKKNNLCVNVPPGSMKSTIISVCLPSWIWVNNPSYRMIFISGNEGIALRDSMKCRDIIESQKYQSLFNPLWKLSPDQNAKGFYKNTRTGFRKSLSAGARITGDRANMIVVDDPNDAAEIHSEPARKEKLRWWDDAASNRLTDMVKDKRILIQQRLHEEDLTGHILSKSKADWDFLIIRMEYEKPTEKDPDFYPTTLGWTDSRNEGQLYFEARFPQSVVEQEKRSKGSHGYAGQYQQRPEPAGGNIVKRAWFAQYNTIPSCKYGYDRSLYARVIQYWDTASTDKQHSAESVCVTIGESQQSYDILDIWHEKIESIDLYTNVLSQYEKHSPSVVQVENKSSGIQLIQALKRETKVPIIGKDRGKGEDKTTRLYGILPFIESGKIRFPIGKEFTQYAIDQFCSFPTGKLCDVMDATVGAVEYLIENKAPQNFNLTGIRRR